MAELRLIVLALAACRASRASVDLPAAAAPAIPDGWRALPAIAEAVGAAAGEHEAAAAWGEPAMGCYAASIALHGGGGALDAMTKQVLDGLAAEHVVTSDVSAPPSDADRGALALAFARGDYHGRARVELARDGRVAALACFWNDREPVACAAACDKVLR
jgi:hypothetical protein